MSEDDVIVAVTWSMEAAMRLHGLMPGPCTPQVVRYELSDGRSVDLPLSLPIAAPASRGRTVMTLPAPPGGGDIKRAELLAEDSSQILEVRCTPPIEVAGGDTWSVPVEAPV